MTGRKPTEHYADDRLPIPRKAFFRKLASMTFACSSDLHGVGHIHVSAYVTFRHLHHRDSVWRPIIGNHIMLFDGCIFRPFAMDDMHIRDLIGSSERIFLMVADTMFLPCTTHYVQGEL